MTSYLKKINLRVIQCNFDNNPKVMSFIKNRLQKYGDSKYIDLITGFVKR